MFEREKIEIALMLVVGICMVLLLPTVELLPATTRAWRQARTLLPSVRRLARAATKLSARAMTALFVVTASDFPLVPADIVSLHCARLC
jgi:hypothetical protein